jgi:hypothetical protein
MSEEVDVSPAAEDSEEQPGEDHRLKADLREGAAKAWGLAVELGSILGGQSGEIVEAEREVAKAEAEELIDRIDGEG